MKSYEERTQMIRAGRLLDAIRETPPLYLGERSLTALWHFLHGFAFAEHIHRAETVIELSNDFHEWVAYRLHYYESTKGWRQMILEQTLDESAAFDRFYELLDDHRARQPRVVGTIEGHPREYSTRRQGENSSEAIQKLMPEKLILVAYTDDPGLFLSTFEGSDNFPGKDRLFRPYLRFRRDMITVLDEEAFDRWLQEDERQGPSAPGTAKKLFR